MISRLIGLLLFYLFGQINAFAQYEELTVTRVFDQRLIKQNIESITQDASGYVWLGSGNGLLRYDGHDIRFFKHEINNPNSLKNSRIRYSFTDCEGDLWVTTQGGGLSLYDSKFELFHNFFPENEAIKSSEVNNFDFWTITEGANHTLWIGSYSGGGIYQFNKQTRTFKRFEIPLSGFKYFSETSIVIESSSRQLWIGTDESGIAVIDSMGNTLNRFTSELDQETSLPSNNVRTIFEDKKGQIWIGTLGGGLCIYNSQTNSFKKPNGIYQANSDLFKNVYSFFEDSFDNIWIATDDGLLIYNTESERILKRVTHEPFNDKSLATDRVRSIFKDKSGIFWIGNDGGGLHKLFNKKKFIHLSVDPKNAQKLNTNIVRSFIQIDDSTLWIGTQGGGINVLDLPSKKIKHSFKHNPRVPKSISDNEITTFFNDPNYGIWVGTWGAGLNLYDKKSNTFKSYRFNAQDSLSLSDDRIQLIHLDSKGNYWVGTENGLNLFDPKTGKSKRFQSQPNNSHSISGNSIQTLAFVEDKEDIYWIGTWQGLNRFDKKNNTFKRFVNDSNNPNSISADHVISLYDDGKGSLWIGTFSGGLNHFDKASEQFTVYTEEDGLPNNVVFGILSGKENELWLSTNNGLSLFNPDLKVFKNYNEEDGVQSNEFWWGAAYKSDDGRLHFGGTNGLTMFYPDSIEENTFSPPIVISSFKVFDEAHTIHSQDVIQLDYDKNYITIEFAALDFTNSDKNQYAYQLVGLDNDWIYSGNRHVVSYAFLNHGEYVFKVKGANSNGNWNNEGTELSIRILPPFWKELWFLLVLSFVLILSIIAMIRLRTRKIESQNKKLEALVLERTNELALNQFEILKRNDELKNQAEKLRDQNLEIEFQKNTILKNSDDLALKNQNLIKLNQEKNYLMSVVAHDLRNPLAAIKSLIDYIKTTPSIHPDEYQEILSVMDKSINRQFEMIDKILDSKAAESGSMKLQNETILIHDVLQSVIDSFANYAAEKGIQLETFHLDKPIQILADKNTLSQVFENLVSNTLKFSPKNSSIKIYSKIEQSHISIGFSDKGAGLSEEDKLKLFGKFQRLSAKPTAGESSTGLGLSIVKRFVEAMNGKVWCESERGKGSTFWVQFEILNS